VTETGCRRATSVNAIHIEVAFLAHLIDSALASRPRDLAAITGSAALLAGRAVTGAGEVGERMELLIALEEAALRDPTRPALPGLLAHLAGEFRSLDSQLVN
jgi:hypothetical protein